MCDLSRTFSSTITRINLNTGTQLREAHTTLYTYTAIKCILVRIKGKILQASLSIGTIFIFRDFPTEQDLREH